MDKQENETKHYFSVDIKDYCCSKFSLPISIWEEILFHILIQLIEGTQLNAHQCDKTSWLKLQFICTQFNSSALNSVCR